MFETEKSVFEDILKTYGRTTESLNEDIGVLREWMKKQPHLPEVMDDKRLQNFLLLNKCSIEKAKQKIDNYYTIQFCLMPDMFEKCNPKHSHFKKVDEIIYTAPIPKVTKEHHRVIFYKLRTDEVDAYEPIPGIQRTFQLQEVRLAEDYMFGDILVIDLDNIRMGHVLKFIPIIHKIVAVYEKILSMPMKRLYFLNSFPGYEVLRQIVQKYLKPKLVQRVHFYSDITILHEILQKDQIPADYGGHGKSLKELQEMLVQKIGEHQDRFDKLDTFKVDESLRPEKLKNDEILGFYGNFKTLRVD